MRIYSTDELKEFQMSAQEAAVMKKIQASASGLAYQPRTETERKILMEMTHRPVHPKNPHAGWNGWKLVWKRLKP